MTEYPSDEDLALAQDVYTQTLQQYRRRWLRWAFSRSWRRLALADAEAQRSAVLDWCAKSFVRQVWVQLTAEAKVKAAAK